MAEALPLSTFGILLESCAELSVNKACLFSSLVNWSWGIPLEVMGTNEGGEMMQTEEESWESWSSAHGLCLNLQILLIQSVHTIFPDDGVLQCMPVGCNVMRQTTSDSRWRNHVV